MIKQALKDDSLWDSFFHEKTKYLYDLNQERLDYYINNYKEIVDVFIDNNYMFSAPSVSKINKKHSSKKRIIYIFPKDDLLIQSFIAWYLHKYDDILSDNCIAYKKCNYKFKLAHLFENMPNCDYAYKVDISNYFNSINTNILIDLLKQYLDDELLIKILIQYLKINNIYINTELCEIDKHGIFTGSPLSGFLSNIYLTKLDYLLDSHSIKFLRYSDDIIVTGSKEVVDNAIKIIHDYIETNDLTINTNKEFIYSPGSQIEFLGFSYQNGTFDISKNSRHKLFNKIRRIARGIHSEFIKGTTSYENATITYFSKINKIFYENNIGRTWTIWFFPVINTDKTLKEIDQYIIMYARYIYVGKFNKSLKSISYDLLKSYGFKSLVNSFYKYKKKTTK